MCCVHCCCWSDERGLGSPHTNRARGSLRTGIQIVALHALSRCLLLLWNVRIFQRPSICGLRLLRGQTLLPCRCTCGSRGLAEPLQYGFRCHCRLLLYCYFRQLRLPLPKNQNGAGLGFGCVWRVAYFQQMPACAFFTCFLFVLPGQLADNECMLSEHCAVAKGFWQCPVACQIHLISMQVSAQLIPCRREDCSWCVTPAIE